MTVTGKGDNPNNIAGNMQETYVFPTCQVRLVRFYLAASDFSPSPYFSKVFFLFVPVEAVNNKPLVIYSPLDDCFFCETFRLFFYLFQVLHGTGIFTYKNPLETQK